MENPQETETIKRWAIADQERQQQQDVANTTGGSRKRPRRAIENGNTLPFVEELAESSGTGTARKTMAASKKKKDPSAQSRTRTQTRVAEIVEVEEDAEEVEEVGSGMMDFFTRR